MLESHLDAAKQKPLDLKDIRHTHCTITVVDWILTAAMPRKIESRRVGCVQSFA